MSQKRRSSLYSRGEPLVWMTGAALAIGLAMVLGLLALVFYNGATTFWPVPITKIQTTSGRIYMGELAETDDYEVPPHVLEQLPPEQREALAAAGGRTRRRMFRTGNFRLTNTHFNWISDFEVVEETEPEWAVIVERLEWGRFYGFPKEFRIDGKAVATEPAEIWELFLEHHAEGRERREVQKKLEHVDTGKVNDRLKKARLEAKQAQLDYGRRSAEAEKANEKYAEVKEECGADWAAIREEILKLKNENRRYQLLMETADGMEREIEVAGIVRAYPANQLGWWERLGTYVSRWWEYLWDEPREANSEGGVYPAIFGTVTMTLIMSLLVVPFGVLAALYLREYAKQGFIISMVRIAVNNLAGVPSIVFGVFGLGFFCYIIGASIDQLLFEADLPNPTYGKGGLLWASLTLALLTLPVVIVATEEALAAVPNSMREGSYACGASKWQTIRRIVLPRAAPGIMTGMILAIARGAGEVAPLMLVGAVKLAPKLPIDGTAPFLHPERSFMHLGFHIYDLGFQSPNSQAAKPMVYTTTLLLITIVVLLNVAAIVVRARLKRAHQFG
jgi:phosphate transport system permease protein